MDKKTFVIVVSPFLVVELTVSLLSWAETLTNDIFNIKARIQKIEIIFFIFYDFYLS